MCAKISKNYKTAKWFLQKKQKMTKICLAMIFFCNFAAKIMKISALYRRFREWQKTPFHYQDHSDHVERCANCGTEFQSNFCPVCGQKSGVGPINWRSVRQGLMVIWGMDSRSLCFSIVQLLLRPGYLISDYISGKRLVSFPPVKMLLIVAVVTMMIETLGGDNSVTEEGAIKSSFELYYNWADKNHGWAMMAASSLFLLPTWLLFRNAPKHRKHTLPEGFFIQVFMATLFALIGIIFTLSQTYYALCLLPLYYLITYRQLFGYGWWGTFWRLCICYWVAADIVYNLQELGNYLLHLEMKPIKALLYADGTTVFLVLIGLLVDYHKINTGPK